MKRLAFAIVFTTSIASLIAKSRDARADRREVGNLVFDGIPQIPDAVREAGRPYENARGASLHDWLPDGSAVIGTRFAEASQVHRVAVPGGARQQLTFLSE